MLHCTFYMLSHLTLMKQTNQINSIILHCINEKSELFGQRKTKKCFHELNPESQRQTSQLQHPKLCHSVFGISVTKRVEKDVIPFPPLLRPPTENPT